MATTTIIQFTATGSDTLQNATKALQKANISNHSTLGPTVQDPNTLQATTEGNSNDITTILRPILGAPTSTTHLPYPILSNAGPATFPVIEYVQSFFPVSKLTPEFKSQIEADFEKFFSIVQPGGPKADPGKIVYGWSSEAEHPDIQGERAQGFTVTRGWQTMEAFQSTLETEEFKRAIPILYGWGAPYKMWHVEMKFQNESD